MQERVARPIGEFNEAKPLFGAEPFNDPTDRWTGRGLHGCSVEPGSVAECTRLRVVGFGVEITTPRTMEVSVSHWLPKLRLVLGQFGRETGGS